MYFAFVSQVRCSVQQISLFCHLLCYFLYLCMYGYVHPVNGWQLCVGPLAKFPCGDNKVYLI